VAWWVPLLNALMAPAAPRLRRQGAFAALAARAAARTGIAQAPDPEFLADLSLLHESFLAVPELSFMGLAGVQAELLRHLSNWLRVRKLLADCPQAGTAAVRQPVFVVGLPRTGTTLLHSLLAGTPGHRAPRLWELLSPRPVPAGEPEPGRQIREAGRFVRSAHLAAPALRVIHPLGARAPEESVFALPQSMSYYTRARVEGYRDWFSQRDATADYTYLRQQLQILQWQSPPRRWVLKSPFHLWNLDALLRVFPDATIVWTHRDPAAVLPSWCSLTEVTMALHNRRVDLRLLGQDWSRMWAQAWERGQRVREHATQPFIDVSYARLSRDPVDTLAGVLHRLASTPPSPQRQHDHRPAGHQPGRHRPGRHRYSLTRYGLQAQAIRDAFPGEAAAGD
jgi:sulfotransferase family protein